MLLPDLRVLWLHFSSVNMTTTVKLAVLLLSLSFCRGLKHNYIDDYEVVEVEEEDQDRDLVFQPSKHGSLWPLPQKVQISDVSFKLMGSSFKIVDARQSSAGPSCSLLQDAYRRWDAFIWFAVAFCLCAPWCVQGPLTAQQTSGPSVFSVCVRRYYEYMFGSAKRQQPYKSKRTGPTELTELQVWITSPDSECDGYPSVTSNESCESLPLWYHFISTFNLVRVRSAARWVFLCLFCVVKKKKVPKSHTVYYIYCQYNLHVFILKYFHFLPTLNFYSTTFWRKLLIW